MAKKLVYSYCIFFLLPFLLIAADSPKSYTIKWLGVFENPVSPDYTFKTLNFTGASFDENFNPHFVLTKDINSYASKVDVQLKNIITEPLLETDLVYKKELIGTDFEVKTNVVARKKKFMAAVSILPIRKSSSGGYERLVSFEVEINPTYSNTTNGVQTYAASSVLATGDWYKIGVIQTGVHKIDYNFLKSIGLDVDNLDPRNLKIYNNGFGMLPYLNSAFRYDDLQENAIQVVGESDSHFDSDDYILFFGSNPTKWIYDSANAKFSHQINIFSDTTYYFLTISSSPGKRIQTRASLTGAPTTVNDYDDYLYHEAELYSLIKSGREWFGESMDYLNNSVTINSFVLNLNTSNPIYFRSNIAGRSTLSTANSFSVSLNSGAPFKTQPFSFVGPNTTDPYCVTINVDSTLHSSSSSINLKFTLNSADQNAKGWLNYFELNFRRFLSTANGTQFSFRDKNSVGPGNINEFKISNNTVNNYSVWDVTDPINVVNQQVTNINFETSFQVNTDRLREFHTFDGLQFMTPIFREKLENQNLHAYAESQMLIVTNPLFLQQAAELAEFHRSHDNLSVVVVTTQQIFNEFSSGAQDVSAIRNFIKMFYDRAVLPTDFPKYVLLFGDASYDNKYRIASNTNFVTSYESVGSTSQTQTYMSDDFFGLLDDNEGVWSSGEILDVAVGRVPVKSTSEAQSAVNKIIHYVAGNQTPDYNPTMGNWRNSITFVADDQDHNTHIIQADGLATTVKSAFPLYNMDKIYLDAYNQESTPGGQRYPGAHQAIVDRVQRGTLLMTYIGHGFELGWAHERVLEISDINGWTNIDHMPAFLTATCEFTRVDDPGRTSAGELVFLNPKGGGICLFTTSRLAFSSSNYNLCQKFFTHVFDKSSGEYPTSGEIFERTKVDYYSDQYVRNFLLIGDPAVRLSYPKYSVKTNTVNSVSISQPTDTLKALSKMTITGEVQDNSGNKMTSFNGIVYPTVYDKTMLYNTIGNDSADKDPSSRLAFYLQKNIIYNGKISATNGDFSYTFTVPKDVAFQFGHGKLSYYAQNGNIDATGYDSVVVVGGLNNQAVTDNVGPKVRLYINDEKFVRGGMTDPNPVLYAIVEDSTGINTIGTGIATT